MNSSASQFKLRPSIRISLDNLDLKYVFVIYPGTQRFPLASQVQVEAVLPQTLVKGVFLLNGL